MMSETEFVPFTSTDDDDLRKLIESVGWNERQIRGQVQSALRFASDENCKVILARRGGQLVGFISAEFHEWNRLGQIHGLVVHPMSTRSGVASRLVREIERFMKEKGARGVYVDTPAGNVVGRKFYEAVGYKQDYTMTEYYDEGADGVTYLKFFKWG